MLILLGLLFIKSLQPFVAYAEPNLQNLYINPSTQKHSEAIIFYNTANQCYNCPQTIEQIITILKKNYPNSLNIYLINIEEHPEFIHTFNLSGPLTLVLVRISDGASFGYTKLTGLQSQLHDPISLKNQITEKINFFLQIPPQN